MVVQVCSVDVFEVSSDPTDVFVAQSNPSRRTSVETDFSKATRDLTELSHLDFVALSRLWHRTEIFIVVDRLSFRIRFALTNGLFVTGE